MHLVQSCISDEVTHWEKALRVGSSRMPSEISNPQISAESTKSDPDDADGDIAYSFKIKAG